MILGIGAFYYWYKIPYGADGVLCYSRMPALLCSRKKSLSCYINKSLESYSKLKLSYFSNYIKLFILCQLFPKLYINPIHKRC